MPMLRSVTEGWLTATQQGLIFERANFHWLINFDKIVTEHRGSHMRQATPPFK